MAFLDKLMEMDFATSNGVVPTATSKIFLSGNVNFILYSPLL